AGPAGPGGDDASLFRRHPVLEDRRLAGHTKRSGVAYPFPREGSVAHAASGSLRPQFEGVYSDSAEASDLLVLPLRVVGPDGDDPCQLTGTDSATQGLRPRGDGLDRDNDF